MKKFNAGDRVVMVRPSCYSFDKVGNTGTVTSVEAGLLLVVVDDYRMPIGGGGWAYFELAENWEVIEEVKEMQKRKFKVGDLVKGNNPKRYFYTNDKMTKGMVIRVYDQDEIRVRILEHSMEGVVGDEYNVDPQYFDFYEEPKKESTFTTKFKVGDKVKVVRLNSDFGYLDYPRKNIGVVGVVRELLETGCTIKCDFEVPLWFHYEALELVQDEKPKTTVLKLGNYKIVFNGDTTVVTDGARKGVAKRHPDDEYDAIVGLQVALERFHGGRKPEVGDKVRVLKVDGNSPYSDHHWEVGDVVTVVDIVYNSDSDKPHIHCFNPKSIYSYQRLIAGEYEVIG